MKPKIQHPPLNPRSQPELKALADRVGQFIEYWGFKAVHGRLWCYLYLSESPLSSRQLAELLKISPALVTQSVQILLEYGVILDAEKGANGALRYRANPNVAEAIAGVLSSREARMMDQLSAAMEALQKAPRTRKVSESGISISMSRLEKVDQWIHLSRMLLLMGIGGLKSEQNPFDHPESFRKSIQGGTQS